MTPLTPHHVLFAVLISNEGGECQINFQPNTPYGPVAPEAAGTAIGASISGLVMHFEDQEAEEFLRGFLVALMNGPGADRVNQTMEKMDSEIPGVQTLKTPSSMPEA